MVTLPKNENISKDIEKVSPFRVSQQFHWVDWMKSVAIIWIFINHAVEAVYGGPYLGNPGAWWPSIQERVAQWIPLVGYGIWTIPINIWRYIGWLGDQGVSLFLVVSGFGLTWGILSKSKPSFSIIQFYKQRLFRIYPLWWGVHIAFLIASMLTNVDVLDMSITDKNFYLSFLGIRALPGTFSYFSPAWWYIGLLIQLYFVFPILWRALNKLGPFRFLLFSTLLGLLARTIVIILQFKVSSLLYGAFFVTRLPEFAFGMTFAVYLSQNQKQVNRLLFYIPTILGGLLIYVFGTLLSLTWAGMVFAPFIVGMSLFTVIFGILGNKKESLTPLSKTFTWVGQHSYSIYLVHHPIILLLVPGFALRGTLISIPVTIICAGILEILVKFFTKIISPKLSKVNWKIAIKWTAISGVFIFLFALCMELVIQKYDPQEVIVWGEQPSLAANKTFGWYLIPNKTTRLRWESYDYDVTSNELGFPGPSYPIQKTPETIRIMTFGDAFTSAEGVNTNQAWPRLLEKMLTEKLPHRKIEVMNFAVTGYGPNQYTEVAKSYIPKYHPDIILISFYVNDFQDVLITNEDFQSQIGFEKQTAFSLYSTLRLSHTRHLLHKVIDQITIKFQNRPYLGGYFSGAEFVVRKDKAYETPGKKGVLDRLSQIKTLTDEEDATLILFMVPVPVQVCGPTDVTYYPVGYDLSDKTLFDLDKPQKMTTEIANMINIKTYDLRTPFLSAGICPNQPRNLHWTVEGHQIVADYITSVLFDDQIIPK